MPREEYIRVYRSDQPNATPSLTAGEIAANLVDGKFFVGGTNGSLISFNDITRSVASVAVGASSFTGAVSITNGSNVTISTANNTIAISASVAVGATGYTIVSGIGSGISSIAGNIYSINNLGVTSFNGSTGAVNYYPPFATASVTGVAAFPASFFSVANGVVSLSGAYASTLTGDTVGATGSMTANTVNGVKIIDARLATINATGVASFSSTNFDVANGAVSIKNSGVPNTALVNSSITVSTLGPGLGGGGSVSLGNTVTLSNLGVTGISANTNSGITISGTTGQVVISNSGVTGVTAGYGILASSITGNITFQVAGLTTTQSLDSFSVQGSNVFLSLGQKINLIRNSQDYVAGSSDWNAYGSLSPTPTSLGNNSDYGWPGNATGGIEIVFNTANSNNGIYQVWPTGSLQANTTYTASCWARTNGGAGKCRFSYYDNERTTSFFSDDFDLTDVPQRVAFTFTTRSANTSSNVAFGNGSGNAGGTVRIWGFQLERGRFATDPVRTYGATAASTPRIININDAGVTGISANTNSGITISGTTGQVVISNSGVTGIKVGNTTLNGNVSITNGTYSTVTVAGNQITVDLNASSIGGSFNVRDQYGVSDTVNLTETLTFTGSPAIAVSGSNNQLTFFNTGVTSFNGSTGAVSYYPPIASESATGVASFNSTNFSVNEYGAVSLIYNEFSLKDGADNTNSVSLGDTLTITGGRGVAFIRTAPDTYEVRGVTATSSVLGVASFNSTRFSVVNGAVDLAAPYQITGDTVGATGSLTANTVSGVKIIDARLADTSVTGVASFNNLYFDVTNGVVSLNTTVRKITVRASDNTSDTINLGDTLVLTGSYQTGIHTTKTATDTILFTNVGVTSFNGSTGAVSYYPPFATSSVTGVASFPPTYFSVANGVVSLSGAYASTLTGDTVGATGSLTANTVSGVRVIDARLATINATGVASFDTNNFTVSNGAVSIKVGGVTNAALANSSFVIRDGENSTNSVSLGEVLVITGGTGVVFKKTSDDNFEIYSNFTINGTPPVGNDFTVITDGKLSIPLASDSVTGVASFRDGDFDVSITGAVSLDAVVAKTNTAQTFTALQTFSGGITGSTAHFRTASIPQIGSEQIGLSGDGAGIYFASGIDPAYQPYIGFPQRGLDDIHIVSGGVIRIGNPDSDYPGNDGAIIINDGVLSIQSINTINGAVRTVNQIGNNVTINGGLGIRADTGATTITIHNLGVTSFNGSTGAVSYYPPFATQSVTGVASFDTNNFTVTNGAVSIKNNGVPNIALANSSITVSTLGPGLGGGGSVSLGNTVTLSNLGVTGISTNTNSGITISGTTGQVVISNSGVTGFRVGGTLLTGTPSLTNNSNITRSGINLIPSGQDIAVWNAGVTSLNGLTGARTLTGDGGAIRGVNNNAITALTGGCGFTGVVGVDCTKFIINQSGIITGLVSGGSNCDPQNPPTTQAACDACGGTWQGNVGGGGSCLLGFTPLYSGLGNSAAADGSISYFYLDVNNLSSYAGDFTTKTTPRVVMFDPDETGFIKSKSVSIQDLFVKNYNVFESKTPNQLASPSKKSSNDKIELEIVTGLIAQGDQGLLKGASAHEYITNNTISAINGCTGGTFSITGTTQEVTVTTGINCRQIVIGLPEHVVLTSISATGATFTQTVTATRFIGIVSGGDF